GARTEAIPPAAVFVGRSVAFARPGPEPCASAARYTARVNLASDRAQAQPLQPTHGARGHRRLMGFGIIALIQLLQVVTQYLVGHERGRLLSHLVYLAIGLPILMGTFSLGFAYATRK